MFYNRRFLKSRTIFHSGKHFPTLSMFTHKQWLFTTVHTRSQNLKGGVIFFYNLYSFDWVQKKKEDSCCLFSFSIGPSLKTSRNQVTKRLDESVIFRGFHEKLLYHNPRWDFKTKSFRLWWMIHDSGVVQIRE